MLYFEESREPPEIFKQGSPMIRSAYFKDQQEAASMPNSIHLNPQMPTLEVGLY